LDISVEIPNWLDSVTKTLAGLKLHQKFISKRNELIQQKAEVCHKELERQRVLERIAAEERKKQEEAQFEAARLAILKQKQEEEQREKAARQAALERQKQEAERLAEVQAKQRAIEEALERQRQAEIQARVDQICSFCRTHNITSLVHFTHVNNLASILLQGLLSRNALERLPTERRPKFNDEFRIDGCKEAVCLSISFPNYKMFYPLSHENPSEWVILLLDASILWELDCAFCHENAASNNVRFIPLPDRKNFQALARMYTDHPTNVRSKLHIPDYYPTHPQAEVLVFDAIHPRYIRSVHFSNINILNQWQDYQLPNGSPLIKYDVQYFSPRCDWADWKANPDRLVTNDEKIPETEPDFDEPNFFWGEPPVEESLF
jgi:hypothetical protein